MKHAVLSLEGVSKSYGSFTALSNFNMHVQAGEIIGLAGPNGAGKTTLFKIISGLLPTYEGHCSLYGSTDASTYRHNQRFMGTIIEQPAFYPELSGYDNLHYFAIQRGLIELDRIDEVLQLVNLSREDAKRKFKAYSLGMKQRLAIALALIHEPQLLILDEPTNGLDPEGIYEMRQLFKMLSEVRGVTLIISSHILSELEFIADRFIIINRGHKMAEFTKHELFEQSQAYLEVESTRAGEAAVIFEEAFPSVAYEVREDLALRIYSEDVDAAEVAKLLIQADIPLTGLYRKADSLEDFYLNCLKGDH